MAGAITPLPNTPSRRGAQLKKKKRMDIFNFYGSRPNIEHFISTETGNSWTVKR
jgi:hypothetical protein